MSIEGIIEHMKVTTLTVRSEVWLYPGMAGNWHFASLSRKQSKEIDDRFGKNKKGWGSLPVSVTLGETTWKTSIFPDKREQAYILPLKAEVRKKEEVYKGDKIEFAVDILP